MKNDFEPQRLHVQAFAKAAASLVGEPTLAHFPRLLEETQGAGADVPVGYSARGEVRHEGQVGEAVWLHLSAQVALPLTCQRCLGTVDFPLAFDRSFRFVATEELAASEDEESQEDVLVLSRNFNVLELIEDEFLMAMPAVPKHEVCPVAVTLQVADPDFVEEGPAEKVNPFAVLEQLKKKPVT